jgi:hypothetical protein
VCGEVSFAKFPFLPSWFDRLLEANFSCFGQITLSQMPNCWSCSNTKSMCTIYPSFTNEKLVKNCLYGPTNSGTPLLHMKRKIKLTLGMAFTPELMYIICDKFCYRLIGKTYPMLEILPTK